MTGPIIRFGISSRSPLVYWAANNNFADAIPLMKKAGADLEAVNWQGVTALFMAIFHNHYHATDALVAAGADVNHATVNGILPLRVARENKNADIEYLLLKAGAKDVPAAQVGGGN